jgi:hypothetical protein
MPTDLKFTVRVKYNEKKNQIAILRFCWDGKDLKYKETLDKAGSWVRVPQGDEYIWDAVEVLVKVEDD